MNKEQLQLKALQTGLRTLGYVHPSLSAAWAARIFTTPQRHDRPKRERALAQSGAPAVVDGLSTLSWGVGPRIILLHGWSGRGTQLGAFVDPLVDAGFSVTAVDGPAHGDSPGKRTHAMAFARALKNVTEYFSAPYAVIAHSMGAGAAALAQSFGWTQFEKLVLIAGPSNFANVIRRYTDLMKLDSRTRISFENLIERQVGIGRAHADLAGLASGIRAPTLVVHDVGDNEVPFADAESLVRALPQGKLHKTEGLGHRRVLRDPNVLKTVKRFIQGENNEK